MSRVEEEMLNRYEIRPWIRYRYFDDVLFICSHGEEKSASILKHINSYHQTIIFTMEISQDITSYLDALVSRHGRVLETNVLFKSTDTHQYLQKSSCHPWHVRKDIQYEQALGISRICSDEETFRMRSEEVA